MDKALCKGASVRSTARMVDVSKNTVLKLMVELEEAGVTGRVWSVVDLLALRVSV